MNYHLFKGPLSQHLLTLLTILLTLLTYLLYFTLLWISILRRQAAFCSQHRSKLGSAMRTMFNRLVLAPAPMRTMLNRRGSSCGPADLCLKRVEFLLRYLPLNRDIDSSRFSVLMENM